MKFKYGKESSSKIDEGLKNDIEEAYGKYYERRARELRNKRILWAVGGLVILALMGFTIWRALS